MQSVRQQVLLVQVPAVQAAEEVLEAVALLVNPKESGEGSLENI
jgi:hypothetical protein